MQKILNTIVIIDNFDEVRIRLGTWCPALVGLNPTRTYIFYLKYIFYLMEK